MTRIPGIDLHLHTSRSDGRFDARTLVSKLQDAVVEFAAVTDHDTLFGARDLIRESAGTKISALPGMEISTAFFSGEGFVEEVHVLWYGMNPEARKVIDFESEIRTAQNGRIVQMVEGLRLQGIKLNADEAIESSSPAPACYVPLIFQLIASGYLKLDFDAIRGFIDGQFAPGGKVYVPPSIKTDEAVSRAKSIGGLIVAAHPSKIANPEAKEWLLQNSDAVEALYGAHSAEVRDLYKSYCKTHGKLISCGSDYHGYYETEYSPPALSYEEAGLVMDFVSKARHV